MLATIRLLVSGLLCSLVTAAPTNTARTTLPSTFNIGSFTLLTPASTNSNPPTISFAYSDPSTNVSTSCDYSGTTDATAVYPCANPIVTFQWNSTSDILTIGETLAPGEVIYGDLGIGLYCYPVEPPIPYGYGTECQNPGGTLTGEFTQAVAK